MNEDVEVYMEDTGAYVVSLIGTRINLETEPKLLAKLDKVIEAELDLALMGAEKAKSEILKAAAKDNLRPIK